MYNCEIKYICSNNNLKHVKYCTQINKLTKEKKKYIYIYI